MKFLCLPLGIILLIQLNDFSATAICTNTSVEGDATYCIQGLACSRNIHGKCPSIGDQAIGDCQPGAYSYNATSKSCILKDDAICARLSSKIQTYGCRLKSRVGKMSYTRIPEQIRSNTKKSTPGLLATFSPKYAGGVDGHIHASYGQEGDSPFFATINVDLNLQNFQLTDVIEKYPNCSYSSLSFAWHLHVIWNNSAKSGFMDQCSSSKTGGHYDPNFACGPKSQYFNDATCKMKMKMQKKKYKCTSTTYMAFGCEAGDFYGKFGALTIKEHTIKKKFNDYYFPPLALCNKPMYMVPKVQWNFVLHLMCPQHKNPRILCAKAKEI